MSWPAREDGSSAIRWFAAQPGVDASRIYTFGHSAGGIVSALLSLRPVPIRHGGSSGGLYGTGLFDVDWVKAGAPFDVDDPKERELRVLVGNVRWMQKKHYAYVGSADPDQQLASVRRELEPGSRLEHCRDPRRPLHILRVGGEGVYRAHQGRAVALREGAVLPDCLGSLLTAPSVGGDGRLRVDSCRP